MIKQIDLITSPHKDKFAVIDTNLLLVYLVGCIDPQLITKFKKTNSRYCAEDFKILDDLISKFDNFVTTPNILTEVSNLGGQLNDNAKKQFFVFLAQFIQKTAEKYIQSSEISKDSLFIKFGVTDRGLLELARTQHLIITDDFKLSSFCISQGFDSINFNHLRNYVNY
jgi:hypothetical protein